MDEHICPPYVSSILNKRIQYMERFLDLNCGATFTSCRLTTDASLIHAFCTEEIHLYFSISLKCLARSVAAFG